MPLKMPTRKGEEEMKPRRTVHDEVTEYVVETEGLRVGTEMYFSPGIYECGHIYDGIELALSGYERWVVPCQN